MSRSSSSDHCKKKKKKLKKICLPIDLNRVACKQYSFVYTGPTTAVVCYEQLSLVNPAAGAVTLTFPQCPTDGMQQTVKATASPIANTITVTAVGSFIESPAALGTIPPATTSVTFVGGIAGEYYTWQYAAAVNTWVIVGQRV